MQKQQQQGVGRRNTRDISTENMTKYQTLLANGVFSNKEAAATEQPVKLVTANQEVCRYQGNVCAYTYHGR